MTDSWGQNRQLRPEQVDRAVLQLVQQLAEQDDRKDVPRNINKFQKKAEIFFLDAAGNPVKFERVVVAWED